MAYQQGVVMQQPGPDRTPLALDMKPGILAQQGIGVYEEAYVSAPGSPWTIYGDESQLVEVQLQPGQFLLAEPGTMVHKAEGLQNHISTGGGCFDACGRSCIAGESFLRIKHSNPTDRPQVIGLTPNFPAKVVPIDLQRYSGLTIKSGAFLAAINDKPKFSYRLARPGAACFAGQGFILNELNGAGQAFLNASGTVLQVFLQPGQELLADPRSVVAFERTVTFTVRTVAEDCFFCCVVGCCGGEGFFNALLRGPGMVLLQSMPIEKIAAAIGRRAGGGGGGGGGGSGGGGAH